MSKTDQPPKQRRVIVVDDTDEIRDLLSEFICLLFPHTTVLTFGSSSEARPELRRKTPDLLTTDISHPAGGGWLPMLARRKAKYPVIVVSGSITSELIQNYASLENKFHFLAKPFRFEDLAAILSMYLGPADKEMEAILRPVKPAKKGSRTKPRSAPRTHLRR